MAVVGAGPAGLAVANLLRRAGIAGVLLERESRAFVEQRPRGGFIEEWAVRGLERRGLGERLVAKAPRHAEFEFRYGDVTGQRHFVYPHQLLVTDLLAQYTGAGGEHRIECDFVAGCDGARGFTQGYLPAESTVKAHHDYGIGWPALLAEAPPSADGVLSGIHPRGFGAHMARTPGVTRFSLRTAAGEPEADWPDERVRRELQAHLVAPIAAKGMNLALYDAFLLAEAFQAHYAGDSAPLAGYSAACLPLVWQHQEFSLWLSDIFHHTAAAAENPFPARIAEARMRRLLGSPAAAAVFAELYIGKNAGL